MKRKAKFVMIVVIVVAVGVSGYITGIPYAYGEENASNPLASVNNTDLRWHYFELDTELNNESERNDFYVDGAYMLTPKLKLKYELHYWDTDVTGSSEKDWESFHLMSIYFPKQGEWGAWKYKLAIGAEWIADFGNEDKGIGSGSDQIAPFVGTALMPGGGVRLLSPSTESCIGKPYRDTLGITRWYRQYFPKYQNVRCSPCING